MGKDDERVIRRDHRIFSRDHRNDHQKFRKEELEANEGVPTEELEQGDPWGFLKPRPKNVPQAKDKPWDMGHGKKEEGKGKKGKGKKEEPPSDTDAAESLDSSEEEDICYCTIKQRQDGKCPHGNNY
jgi:hypothetical protein